MTRDHLPKAKCLHWNRSIFICLMLLLPGVAGLAQDLHYSQFYGAPLHLNPSLTGIFRGDVRLMGQYRNQWSAVPVGYTTYTGAVDMKLFSKEIDKGHFWGLGLGFNQDQAGYADLRLSALNLNAAYTTKMGKRFYGSLGGQLGFGARRWQSDQVTYDNQYDAQNGTFNPDNPSGETDPNQKLNYGDFGLGFNVRYQVKEKYEQIDTAGHRTKIDFGMGFFHLNRPNQFFTSLGPIKLPVRLTPYILADLEVGKRWDLMLNAAAQFQTVYRQYLGGAGLRYHISQMAGKQFSVQLGGTFRFDALTNDSAIFPAVEVRYNSIRAGFSYDVNLSQFNSSVDGGVGGPELFIHYNFVRYKKIGIGKNCPLI